MRQRLQSMPYRRTVSCTPGPATDRAKDQCNQSRHERLHRLACPQPWRRSLRPGNGNGFAAAVVDDQTQPIHTKEIAMQAGEVMTTNVMTVRPDATLREAAAMMDDL